MLVEVSPFNPAARRIEGGIWNEDVLPVMDWEIAEMRVVMPADLQTVLGFETPVLRWRRSKFEHVIATHAQPTEQQVLNDLSGYLNRWERAGLAPAKTETWRVFFRKDVRWVLVVIGRDREGSLNAIAMYSPSDKNYLRNMIAKGNYSYREGVQ